MPYMTEERRLIQDTAREFTMREVLPIANKLDPLQEDIPMSLRDKMAEMGYFGIIMPEEYGGLGLGCFEYCLIAEELARGWMSVASIIARAGGVMGVRGWPLEKRIELTKKAARGEYLAAVSLSEPNVGSDLAAVSCRSTAGTQGKISTSLARMGLSGRGSAGLSSRRLMTPSRSRTISVAVLTISGDRKSVV